MIPSDKHPKRPWAENEHYKRIASWQLTTPELIAAARDACRSSLRNTASGGWLGEVLDRLGSEHQNASGRTH